MVMNCEEATFRIDPDKSPIREDFFNRSISGYILNECISKANMSLFLRPLTFCMNRFGRLHSNLREREVTRGYAGRLVNK